MSLVVCLDFYFANETPSPEGDRVREHVRRVLRKLIKQLSDKKHGQG